MNRSVGRHTDRQTECSSFMLMRASGWCEDRPSILALKVFDSRAGECREENKQLLDYKLGGKVNHTGGGWRQR